MQRKDYVIVDHELKLHGLYEYINKYDIFAFDTETTGLNVRKDKVIGLSISGEIGTAYYVPLCTWDNVTQSLKEVCVNKSEFMVILSKLAEKELLMWNASFDCRVVKSNFNIDLKNSLIADSMLMKHTVEEDGFFGLKKVAVQYQKELDLDMEEAANKEQIELKENVAKNGGSTTKTNYEMFKADLDVMGKYACADADLTLRLSYLLRKRLELEKLEEFFYDEEVMPLYKEVTIKMEEQGIKLDMELLLETRDNILRDMDTLKTQIIEDLMDTDDFHDWLCLTSSAKFPAKKTGNFAQKVAERYCPELPISKKSGKYSITKKTVSTLPDSNYKEFLLGNIQNLDLETEREIQFELWKDFNGDYINISSKKQMGDLVFDYMNFAPLSKTATGQGQFNESMIIKLSEKYEWAAKLNMYNKLVKIKGTYIDRFLDAQEDGIFYPSFFQHRTISGRYGSNMQQLNRPKEEGELPPLVLKYNNIIRKFFIAGKGRVFIDSDYESLEPHVFAHVSGDDGLKNIFRKGHDFYSTIAIQTEKLKGVSADKKAENYLGKVNKPLRQKAKAYSLGVPYGMKGFALGKTLGVDQKEAEELINGYLNGFPQLKQWMKKSELLAKKEGYAKVETGRIRHLPKVKEIYKKHGDKILDFRYRKKLEKKLGHDKVLEMYRDYKNGLNNAKNVQIQGLSASIVNRAAIAINRELTKRGIDGWVALQIHDQLVVNVPEESAEECRELVQDIMENVYKLSIELKAPAEIAKDLYEGH